MGGGGESYGYYVRMNNRGSVFSSFGGKCVLGSRSGRETRNLDLNKMFFLMLR